MCNKSFFPSKLFDLFIYFTLKFLLRLNWGNILHVLFRFCSACELILPYLTNLTSTCVFWTLSTDGCSLDWLERSEEPDAVWMVRSLACDLHAVGDWWAVSCHQPPGGLCPYQRKGNTNHCPKAKATKKSDDIIRAVLFFDTGRELGWPHVWEGVWIHL